MRVERADAPRARSLTRAQLLFAVCALFSTAVFAFAVTRPLDWLLGVVPDDAFYYLKIAQNIATTGKSSFDGLNPTNGYHPGWMAVLVVLAKVIRGPIALLRACLVTAFVLHLAASRMLVASLSRWLQPVAAWIAGALWVINPLPVNLALQGVESSLYIFAAVLVLFTYSIHFGPGLSNFDRDAGPRPFVLLGLTLGGLFLARTESVVLTLIVTVGLAFALRASAFWRTLLLTAAAFFVSVLPWFLYSFLATGTWFQRSGSMKMLWAADYHHSVFQNVVGFFGYLFGAWVTYPIIGIPGGWGNDPRAVVDFGVTLTLLWVVWRGVGLRAMRPLAIVALVVSFACLATGGVYGLFFSEMQYWYKAQPGLVFFVVGYGVASILLERLRPQWVKPLLGLTVAALGVALLVRFAGLRSYPHQREVYATQAKFDALLPDGERIGCFNAGIPGYFGKHVVINLDGLVNNALYDYYRRRALDQYLSDAHIRYIADETVALERGMRFTQARPRLSIVAKEPMPGWSSQFRYLWRVETR
jgi:hypothetical protein